MSASSDRYMVLSENERYSVSARGVLKIKSDGIKVGDRVEFDGENISAVLPRKNYSQRLNVSNVDCVNIVIAAVPAPDFLLVDKMIIDARLVGAEVFLTVNKCDIQNGIVEYVTQNYSYAVDEIFVVSTLTGEGIEKVKKRIKGKLVVFAGQSAVGKTSLTNALFGESERVNTVSRKTLRGRHTTTVRKIYFGDDCAVMDTPGFSSAAVYNVKSSDLRLFYKDFDGYDGSCYYIGCTHTVEPDCLVRSAVNEGKISRERYDRYVTIYKEIKEYEKRKY